METQATNVKTIDSRLDPLKAKHRNKQHRQFDWATLLGDKAHLATSITRMLEMQLPNARRHLRWAVYTEKVVVLRNGRYKYYLARETWEKWRSKCVQPNVVNETLEP